MKDYYGKEAEKLKDMRLFLFDMDGTIYQEDRLFDGTIDLLTRITEMGGRYVFLTNNSSKSVTDYIDKLAKMDIKTDADDFFTSSQATIEYLHKNYPGKIVYCQGTESLVKELLEAGIEVVTEVDDRAEIVLVGFDNEMTSQKLRNTCEMLLNDVVYIATNPDLVCPVSFGFVPDCGSICGMLKNATGKFPKFIGKPEPAMINLVMDKFGYSKAETCMIGDRIYTDIAAGLNAGVTAICVLSGEVTVQDIEQSDMKPDYTFMDVREIYNNLTH